MSDSCKLDPNCDLCEAWGLHGPCPRQTNTCLCQLKTLLLCMAMARYCFIQVQSTMSIPIFVCKPTFLIELFLFDLFSYRYTTVLVLLHISVIADFPLILQEAEVPWHLISIAIFFALIKFPGPYYPFWGRIFIPHFANGVLWRVAWSAFLWSRRPRKASEESSLEKDAWDSETTIP